MPNGVNRDKMHVGINIKVAMTPNAISGKERVNLVSRNDGFWRGRQNRRRRRVLRPTSPISRRRERKQASVSRIRT